MIYVKSSSGIGAAELLYDHGETIYPADWSPDGKFLLLAVDDEEGQSDLSLLPLNGKQELIPFLITPFGENDARFSPDGGWVAYTSDESGRYEVYVVPFCSELTPEGKLAPCDRTGRLQVSKAGGVKPLWSRGGKTLYYQSLEGTVMAVPVDGTGDEFTAGVAELLFTPMNVRDTGRRGFAWDVTPDGERFLIRTHTASDATPLTLVLNWTKMLENQ